MKAPSSSSPSLEDCSNSNSSNNLPSSSNSPSHENNKEDCRIPLTLAAAADKSLSTRTTSTPTTSFSPSVMSCSSTSRRISSVITANTPSSQHQHHHPHSSSSYQQQQHAQQLLASSSKSPTSSSSSSSSPSSSPPPPPYAFIANHAAQEWKQRLLHLPPYYTDNGICILAGVMAFGTTLCASTWTQQRLLGITTGTMPPIPSLVGFMTVCVASTAAHRAAIATHQYILPLLLPSQYRYPHYHYQQHDDDQSWTARSSYSQQHYHQYQYHYPPLFSWHTVRVCAVGLLAFKVLLGGRFWAIAPSSYTHLGSFARPRLGSLPATENYASTAQRQVIQKLGRRFGCHTCGTRRGSGMIGRLLKSSSCKNTVEFVGDHMPPKSVADQLNQRFYRRLLKLKASFRFYPQCTVCSDRQGTLLSQATAALRKHQADKAAATTTFLKLGGRVGGQPSLPSLAASTAGAKSSYFHGWKFRFHHLTGGIVAGVTVVNADNNDIAHGNQRRFANWQYQTINRLVIDPLWPYMPSLSHSASRLLRHHGRCASYWIQDNGRHAQEWIQVHVQQTNTWFVQNSRQANQWFHNNMRSSHSNSNNSRRR